MQRPRAKVRALLLPDEAPLAPTEAPAPSPPVAIDRTNLSMLLGPEPAVPSVTDIQLVFRAFINWTGTVFVEGFRFEQSHAAPLGAL